MRLRQAKKVVLLQYDQNYIARLKLSTIMRAGKRLLHWSRLVNW